MSDAGPDGALRRRYEAMRRRWCAGEGDPRDQLGLAVLLRQGMRRWMHHPAHAESREAAGGDPPQPAPASGGASDTVPLKPRHREVARLLATMAIEAIGATREETA